ncbi:Aldo keto reductase [Fusarium sp. NRRL 52700]|nr:Aldo keto reductase [Fusarium sp. NRRL 52700]
MPTSKSHVVGDMPKVGEAVLRLNYGNNMPMLGYGLGMVLHKSSRDQKSEAIVTTTKLAIKYGFRHPDSADRQST